MVLWGWAMPPCNPLGPDLRSRQMTTLLPPPLTTSTLTPAAGAKDEQLWAVVAYLKKLPNVSEADYKAWTAQPAEAPKQ